MTKAKTPSVESTAKNNAKKTAKKAAPKKTAGVKAFKPASVSLAKPSVVLPGVTQNSPIELHEEIRIRAYEFFVERGAGHGRDLEDWHRAELEVRSKYRT